MSVKVGLVAAVAAPKPAVRPLTNCVLPLPSPPLSAITSPALTSSANRRPNAPVSSGLLEMNVATAQFWIFDFRFSIERSNSSQSQSWKFFVPIALQAFAITRRNCEKQLVIFAVGDCVVDLRAARERQTLLVDLESEFARLCQSRKIRAKSVAYVHHRMNESIFL